MFFRRCGPHFLLYNVLVLAVGITGAASQAVGQAGTGETVIQKARNSLRIVR